MNKLLICLLMVGFAQLLSAQFFNQRYNNGNFNRGGWGNGMQNFNRGGWNNGMQNFNRQFYPTSSGVSRTPVGYYNNNNSNQQQQQQGQQQQGNNLAAPPYNGNLIMNNGYPQGIRGTQTGGYYRVDTRRNIWTLVPRPSLQIGVR